MGKCCRTGNGAPLRITAAVEMHGFKEHQASIVEDPLFVAKQPPTTWNLEKPEAYGFYANVNFGGGSSYAQPGGGRFLSQGLLRRPHHGDVVLNGYDQAGESIRRGDLHKNYFELA